MDWIPEEHEGHQALTARRQGVNLLATIPVVSGLIDEAYLDLLSCEDPLQAWPLADRRED